LKCTDKIILKSSTTDKVRKFVNRQGRADNFVTVSSFCFDASFLNSYKNMHPSELGNSRREIGKYRQCIFPSKCLKLLVLFLCNSED